MSENQHDFFNVYYKNRLVDAGSLDAQPLAEGQRAQDLYHPFLSNVVEFASNTAVITAEWGEHVFIDAVALVNCNFTEAEVKLWDNDDALVFEGTLRYRAAVSILKTPEKYHASRVQITIYGSAALEVGYLFVGERTPFPRFVIQPQMDVEVTSKPEVTERGQVYGLKWPTLDTFKVSFSAITLQERADMIEYIKTVQFVEPHIIEPYESSDPTGSAEYPPLYAALTEGGGFKKRKEPGFLFDTSMAWKEAC